MSRLAAVLIVIALIAFAIYLWAIEPQCVRVPDGSGDGTPKALQCRPLWQALLAPEVEHSTCDP